MQAVLTLTPKEVSYTRLFPVQLSSESRAPMVHPGKVLQSWHLSLNAVVRGNCAGTQHLRCHSPVCEQHLNQQHLNYQLLLWISELLEKGNQCYQSPAQTTSPNAPTCIELEDIMAKQTGNSLWLTIPRTAPEVPVRGKVSPFFCRERI